jgi:hypothetical protein
LPRNLLLPAVDYHREMASKAFDEAFRSDILEPLVCERGRQRTVRLAATPHRNEANDGAEDEPIGPRVFVAVCGQPRRPPPTRP